MPLTLVVSGWIKVGWTTGLVGTSSWSVHGGYLARDLDCLHVGGISPLFVRG